MATRRKRYTPPPDGSQPDVEKPQVGSVARDRFQQRKKERRVETGRGYILAVAIIEAVLACLLLYVRLTLWNPDPRIPKPDPRTMYLMELGMTVLVVLEFGMALFYLGLWLLARRRVLLALMATLCINVVMLLLRSIVFLRGFVGCWVAVANIIIIMGLVTGIRSHLMQRKKDKELPESPLADRSMGGDRSTIAMCKCPECGQQIGAEFQSCPICNADIPRSADGNAEKPE